MAYRDRELGQTRPEPEKTTGLSSPERTPLTAFNCLTNKIQIETSTMSAFAPEDPDTHDDYSYTEDPATTSTPPIPQEHTMDPDTDASHDRGHSKNPLLGDNPLVSDLEQEVLDEYARLLRNVNQVRGEDLCSLFTDLEDLP